MHPQVGRDELRGLKKINPPNPLYTFAFIFAHFFVKEKPARKLKQDSEYFLNFRKVAQSY